MGSTVTTGRVAGAFRAQSGTVIYCLYEQTYEKNCYPHTPRWSAIYIGEITSALQQVFDYASCCEGGMLQKRSGWMTPEGYLKSWMSELQSPIRMTRDHSISLYVKAESIYAPLCHETLTPVAATLAAAGLPEVAAQLQAGGKAELSLLAHGDILAQLHKDHQIPAWRLLADYTRPSVDGGRDSSLGFGGARTKLEAPAFPPALVVSEHGDLILREVSGAWRCHGPRYDIMSSYIRKLAPVEHAHPGNSRHLIQSYRDYLEAAPRAEPGEFVVQTDKRLATDEWHLKRIDDAAALPGATSDNGMVTIPFSRDHEYILTHLPRNATTWHGLNEDRLQLCTAGTRRASLL